MWSSRLHFTLPCLVCNDTSWSKPVEKLFSSMVLHRWPARVGCAFPPIYAVSFISVRVCTLVQRCPLDSRGFLSWCFLLEFDLGEGLSLKAVGVQKSVGHQTDINGSHESVTHHWRWSSSFFSLLLSLLLKLLYDYFIISYINTICTGSCYTMH